MNTFTATTSLTDEQVAAFALFKGYKAELTDENGEVTPNPQSINDFTRAEIERLVRTLMTNTFAEVNQYKVAELTVAIQNEAAQLAENNVSVEIA